MTLTGMETSRTGFLLISAQVLLCIALLWFGWAIVLARPWLWLGVATGAAIMVAGVMTMRMSQLRVHPEPGEMAELCERGIYGIIRHPMYAGLLLASAMFAFGAERAWIGWGLWLGLLLVLLAKLRIEERLWLERDRRYADYRKRTKRLVPWLW